MLSRALIFRTLVLVLMLGGCKDRSAAPPQSVASTSDSGTLPAEEPLPFKAPASQLAGTLDVRNRHASTVLIETQAPMEAGVDGQCSGALIGPQVVLTAGHCVCTEFKLLLGERGRVKNASADLAVILLATRRQDDLVLGEEGPPRRPLAPG
jgi:hypothetical protein